MGQLARAGRTSVPFVAPGFEPLNLATPGRELEIKFKTDPAGMKLALESPLLSKGAVEGQIQSLHSVYFDTPSGDLRRHKIVLRMRRVGSMQVMGLKSPRPVAEGPFSRAEIEVPATCLVPDVAQFGAEIAAALNFIIEGRALEPKFETRFERRLRRFTIGGSLIEAAFDEGVIVAGDRRRKLMEIELELKSGEETALYDLAGRLSDSLPVRLEMMSKSAHGFMLATDDSPKPVRAEDIRFPADAKLGEVVETVIASALGQFVANWPAMAETSHPESIHQMRVALRRLRAALGFFNRVLTWAEFEIFRAEARRIASGLGPARDWDALRELIEDGSLAQHALADNFKALLSNVDGRRSAAYAIARDAINDSETTRFVLNLQAALARCSRPSGLSGADQQQLADPAAPFACETLERLHTRTLKRGRHLALKSPEERHGLRLVLKNLRYAAEFFSSFFSGARTYIRDIAQLQDLLGAYNDAASATRLLQDMEKIRDPQVARAAGVIFDLCRRKAAIADENLSMAWKRFKQIPTFWNCPNCVAYDPLQICKARKQSQSSYSQI